MKDNRNKVSYNDIQTFQNSDKVDALKKDPNSNYNSFINSNPNEPDPSSPGTNMKG